MVTAASTEELLWNVSYQALIETMLTRQYVVERRSNRFVYPATEHEETTTSNLLRHIGYYGQNLGAVAVQHTKSLEGGLTRNGRQVIVPSGADLELAIEVSPGRWLDLLLQAKALKPSGAYTSWSTSQNQKLISWAARNGRVPAMLLYNDLVPPFVATAPPMTFGDYGCAAFGGCTAVDRTQLGMWGSNSYCVGPDRTPAGIGLCLDLALMLTQPASPPSLCASFFQLEHLLHVSEHSNAIDAAGRTLDQLLLPAAPRWAAQLLEARESQEDDTDFDDRAPSNEPIQVAARLSAVIPFVAASN